MLQPPVTWLLLIMSLSTVVPSPWSPEAGPQQGPQEQQKIKSAFSITDATKLDGLYVNRDTSEKYAAYLVEYQTPLDEEPLSKTGIKILESLLSNQSVVVTSTANEESLPTSNEVKTVVQLLQTQNELTRYTVETKEFNDTTDFLVETNGDTSVGIVFIPLNRTNNSTEEINELLHEFNLTRWKYILIQNMTIVHKETKSTRMDLEYDISWRESKEYRILRHYVDPAVYLIIFVVGILGNGMLLFLFVRHRELRTIAKVMIINLAVCDILNLSINAPLHFYFHYEGGSAESLTSCRVVLALRQFLRCTGALAVIVLITQRFIIIRNSSARHWKPFILTVLPIIAVWVLPLAIAWPSMYLPEFYEPICFFRKQEGGLSYVIVLNFVLYCVIMPIMMFGFSMNIARRLEKSVKDMPGEIRHTVQEQLRMRSARVMIALAVVFVITYFPFQVWVLLARWVRLDKHHPIMIYALYVSKHLLFANGCFNPIALFIVSSTFKRLLVRYLRGSIEQRTYSTNL
ncbi:neuropeptide CCHamide-2 receptor-like isoform X4 [Zootermopsis nevadensis]|uniref:Neuromedin-B receptor n=2 Tax=Zootermopsis nevadensis TaxID=136037 RepID=A0A067QXW6_ZOONE|nr:neuropeptide CCHamide-2 receptor-like isoform X4 [Zootermopsis nevadensis]KDR09648.1 Neuromedin-B receptor [Zootermopsis nevadensis]